MNLNRLVWEKMVSLNHYKWGLFHPWKWRYFTFITGDFGPTNFTIFATVGQISHGISVEFVRQVYNEVMTQIQSRNGRRDVCVTGHTPTIKEKGMFTSTWKKKHYLEVHVGH